MNRFLHLDDDDACEDLGGDAVEVELSKLFDSLIPTNLYVHKVEIQRSCIEEMKTDSMRLIKKD